MVLQVDGLDLWVGGVKYRAAHGANKNKAANKQMKAEEKQLSLSWPKIHTWKRERQLVSEY